MFHKNLNLSNPKVEANLIGVNPVRDMVLVSLVIANLEAKQTIGANK